MPASCGPEQLSEALLAEILEDEEALFELQHMLSPGEEGAASPRQDPYQRPLPAPTNPPRVAVLAVAQQAVVSPRAEEAADSTPQGQLEKRQRQEPNLPVGPSTDNTLPCSLSAGQSNMTPRQRALHVARRRMLVVQSDVQAYQVVRTLAVALGASRTEAGTVTALHAVLLQLAQPGMGNAEAYKTTRREPPYLPL